MFHCDWIMALLAGYESIEKLTCYKLDSVGEMKWTKQSRNVISALDKVGFLYTHDLRAGKQHTWPAASCPLANVHWVCVKLMEKPLFIQILYNLILTQENSSLDILFLFHVEVDFSEWSLFPSFKDLNHLTELILDQYLNNVHLRHR